MARKYKRDSRGRFAGGGGGGNSGGGGRKSGASRGQKTSKKKVQKVARTIGNATKKAVGVAQRNPRKTVAAAYVAQAVVLGTRSAVLSNRESSAFYAAAGAAARNARASQRGIPALKMAKRSRRGVYNISSMG